MKQLSKTRSRNSVILRNTFIAMGMISFSLMAGTIGYHLTDGFSWLDSFLNAAMVLTRNGPVYESKSNIGKLFSMSFAFYGGVIFLFSIAIFIYPFMQRIIGLMDFFQITKEKK